MSDPLVEWRKVWFFLRNDADMPLPVVTDSHPVPQPKWGYFHRLQPLRDVVQQLLQGGLMDANLLRTFVVRRIQPLRQ
jgi:hypothetical protein